MIDFRLNVEVDRFTAAMRDMQARLGGQISMREVIESEVGQIVRAAMKRTKIADKASIMARAFQPWRTYDMGRGMKRYYLLNRYPDALWKRLNDRITNSIARRMAARGLAKRSWYELGLRMGISISAPAQVRRAISGKGHTGALNVDVKRTGDGGNFTLTIENRSPLLGVAGGTYAFFWAVRGRRRYYEQNLAHGVFSDLAKVAAKYPGVRVSVPPSAGAGLAA